MTTPADESALRRTIGVAAGSDIGEGPVQPVRFKPSRVSGWPGVIEVCLTADALELVYPDRVKRISWLEIGLGREIATKRIPVGELHFSPESYRNSHFIFYTTPPISIYMPADGPTAYPQSHFWMVQALLRDNGFKLYDERDRREDYGLLRPRWISTIAIVLFCIAFEWAYIAPALGSGPVAEAWRHWLTERPRRPAIHGAWALPANILPALLTLRHGRSRWHVAACAITSAVIIFANDYLLLSIIRTWTLPANSSLLWSKFFLGSITVHIMAISVSTFMGWVARSRQLEPLPSHMPCDNADPHDNNRL